VTAAVASPGNAPLTVPYITQWSEERVSSVPVVHRRRGIAYAEERPGDRDEHGVLWIRESSRPHQGRPLFGKIHSRRQLRAITRMLCQVCGGRADRNGDGILWLVCEDPQRPDTWPDQLLISDPPVCADCAAKAVLLCPRLRRHYTALRVSAFKLLGVSGLLYLAGGRNLVTDAGVAYDDPRVRWVKASQLIVRLDEFSITDLDTGSENVASNLSAATPPSTPEPRRELPPAGQ
jgi:hypothetical protein